MLKKKAMYFLENNSFVGNRRMGYIRGTIVMGYNLKKKKGVPTILSTVVPHLTSPSSRNQFWGHKSKEVVLPLIAPSARSDSTHYTLRSYCCCSGAPIFFSQALLDSFEELSTLSKTLLFRKKKQNRTGTLTNTRMPPRNYF